LIDPRDTNAIAEALKKILGDQAFAQQLSQRGLLRSAQFKPSILAAKTLEVYRSIA
jgi:glycosyltransferase involved in cell wall biosynthesis